MRAEKEQEQESFPKEYPKAPVCRAKVSEGVNIIGAHLAYNAGREESARAFQKRPTKLTCRYPYGYRRAVTSLTPER